MIQGYAIYLRTHRTTGKQYAGAVWGSKSTWTPEKAAAIRWRQEDKAGIRGVFGGFDSEVILSEKRSDAPECSEMLYRIRIAVDEDRIIMRIPQAVRLNLISPLVHLDPRFASEEMCRAGGRVSGAANGRKRAQQLRETDPGYYARMRSQRDPAKCRAASRRSGTIVGNRNASSGHMRRIGQMIRGPEAIQRASALGRANVLSGHLAQVQAANALRAKENPEQAYQDAQERGRAAVAAKRANGLSLFTDEARSKGGKTQGPILGARMKAEGRGIFGLTREQRQTNNRAYWLTLSLEERAERIAKLQRGRPPKKIRIRLTLEQVCVAKSRGTHNRWHVNRNIVNRSCQFCKENCNG